MSASERQTIECPSRVFWVGIGCKRGTSSATIEQAIRSVFEAYQLAEDAIAGIATIDTKANEAGLVEFCRNRNRPLLFFAADELRSVVVPTPSGAIDLATGTPSVAEAAAILACWAADGGREHEAIAERQIHKDAAQIVLPIPCTLYLIPQLCIPKQRYRSAQSGAITIAVAHLLSG